MNLNSLDKRSAIAVSLTLFCLVFPIIYAFGIELTPESFKFRFETMFDLWFKLFIALISAFRLFEKIRKRNLEKSIQDLEIKIKRFEQEKTLLENDDEKNADYNSICKNLSIMKDDLDGLKKCRDDKSRNSTELNIELFSMFMSVLSVFSYVIFKFIGLVLC